MLLKTSTFKTRKKIFQPYNYIRTLTMSIISGHPRDWIRPKSTPKAWYRNVTLFKNRKRNELPGLQILPKSKRQSVNGCMLERFSSIIRFFYLAHLRSSHFQKTFKLRLGSRLTFASFYFKQLTTVIFSDYISKLSFGGPAKNG